MSLAFLSVLYLCIVLLVCARVIFESSAPSKTLAYLLFIILVPVIGIIFYLSVGLNYRKRKLYKKKIDFDKHAFPELEDAIQEYRRKVFIGQEDALAYFFPLAQFLMHSGIFSNQNLVKLLINGEEKFPELLDALKQAKHHIHLEYYIYEDDTIGNDIADILIQKANEWVKIRFMYDDYGSQFIRKTLVKKLRSAGIEAFPFYKLNLVQFANRMNYRNHRKIIVIDGIDGFLGGINIADSYINTKKDSLFWRDTHLRITWPAVFNLQYTFLTDWNFCANQNIGFSEEYFPFRDMKESYGNESVQIVSSGPDSDHPNILYSLIQMILLAKKEICITTPYFIPDRSFLDAITIATLRGVRVRLLVPYIWDSRVVNMTSQSHYQDLLESWVEIYRYKKWFIHAKTIVCDELVSVVGTANLDIRSFDLNFETNVIVYSEGLARGLMSAFHEDLKDAEQILLVDWKKRKRIVKIAEKLLYLFSPLM